MKAERARELLYNWHGGQWDPTYAAASSGLVEDLPALIQELYLSSLHPSTSDEDKVELEQLIGYLNNPISTFSVEANGHPYLALPWAEGHHYGG